MGRRSPVHHLYCIPVFRSLHPQSEHPKVFPSTDLFPWLSCAPHQQKYSQGDPDTSKQLPSSKAELQPWFPSLLAPKPCCCLHMQTISRGFSSIISGAGWAPRICAEPCAGLGTWWEDHYEP